MNKNFICFSYIKLKIIKYIYRNKINTNNTIDKKSSLEKIVLKNAALSNGFGTGAAVADIDKDGILELLVSNGESFKQPLNLFKANIKENFSYLRIKPVTKYNAPARGATVTLKSNLRTHAKTIDAGSGYLCQMEPVAHFGIREGETDLEILIKWTDGKTQSFKINELNKEIIVKKK